MRKCCRTLLLTVKFAVCSHVWGAPFVSVQRRGKDPTEHNPEVILNNFTTRLGHSIGRMFAALFPQNPQFVGRQVATFHNQRDFVFFRFHRWVYTNHNLGRCNILTISVQACLFYTPKSQINHLCVGGLCFRYIFKNEKKVGIQELGPRFTLKLRSLQKGTFDSKFGEYEWVLKVGHTGFIWFFLFIRTSVLYSKYCCRKH